MMLRKLLITVGVCAAVTRWLAVIVMLAMASTSVAAQSPTWKDAMNAFSMGDVVGGMRLLRQSAEAGDPDSQWMLGTQYAMSDSGIPQDPIEALKWFEIVVSCTVEEDRAQTMESRDSFIGEMTQRQIEEARQRARAWRAQHPCGP